jgi:hypothetical protein
MQAVSRTVEDRFGITSENFDGYIVARIVPTPGLDSLGEVHLWFQPDPPSDDLPHERILVTSGVDVHTPSFTVALRSVGVSSIPSELTMEASHRERSEEGRFFLFPSTVRVMEGSQGLGSADLGDATGPSDTPVLIVVSQRGRTVQAIEVSIPSESAQE